jgi:hypothetical protein
MGGPTKIKLSGVAETSFVVPWTPVTPALLGFDPETDAATLYGGGFDSVSYLGDGVYRFNLDNVGYLAEGLIEGTVWDSYSSGWTPGNLSTGFPMHSYLDTPYEYEIGLAAQLVTSPTPNGLRKLQASFGFRTGSGAPTASNGIGISICGEDSAIPPLYWGSRALSGTSFSSVVTTGYSETKPYGNTIWFRREYQYQSTDRWVYEHIPWSDGGRNRRDPGTFVNLNSGAGTVNATAGDLGLGTILSCGALTTAASSGTPISFDVGFYFAVRTSPKQFSDPATFIPI